MKVLSKRFYLGSMVGAEVGGVIVLLVAAILLVVSGIFTNFILNLSYAGTWPLIIFTVLVLVGIAAILYGASIWYVLLYKAWATIQDGHAGTTPEKAVGFIFIPFFNFYWIFKVWHGFAADYNRYILRHNLTLSRMKEGLFLAFSILFIGVSLPVLIYIAGLPFLVILAMTSNKAIDGINGIIAVRQSATEV